jgi:uncharacterized protein YneF (UPF0154 family)
MKLQLLMVLVIVVIVLFSIIGFVYFTNEDIMNSYDEL